MCVHQPCSHVLTIVLRVCWCCYAGVYESCMCRLTFTRNTRTSCKLLCERCTYRGYPSSCVSTTMSSKYAWLYIHKNAMPHRKFNCMPIWNTKQIWMCFVTGASLRHHELWLMGLLFSIRVMPYTLQPATKDPYWVFLCEGSCITRIRAYMIIICCDRRIILL